MGYGVIELASAHRQVTTKWVTEVVRRGFGNQQSAGRTGGGPDARRLMGIPVKVNIHSGGKPNGIPERR
jgi:hypothetical protein